MTTIAKHLSTEQSNLTKNLVLAARIQALLLITMTPISNSLTSILSALLAITWITTINKGELKRLWHHPLTKVTLIFFATWCFGALYSSAGSDFISQDIRKYSRILFIPIFISLFNDPTWIKRGLYAFWLAMAITFGTIIAKCLGFIDPLLFYPRKYEAFKDYIYTGLFVAFFVYTLLHTFLHQKKHYFWLIPTLIGCSYYILFISPGRSGQLIFIALCALYVFQRLPNKYKLISTVILSMTVGLISQVPSSFNDRIRESIHNAVHFEENRLNQTETSIGLRFEFYINSWQIFKQKPLLGWGTGSFAETYAKEAHDVQSGLLTTNPHNQYLHIMVTIGVIGLIAYLALLLTAALCSLKTPIIDKYLLQGCVLSLGLGCLANSWLMDYASMMFFTSFIGIFSARYR